MASEKPKLFREIILDCTQDEKWKELVFNCGGISSTLQDIKIIPHSGGYVFSGVRNRYLYWRTNYDCLEVIEQSLDCNLYKNQIRFKFPGAPILDGITVHERNGLVVMLVPTVSSVHRLTFSSPAFEKSYDNQTSSILSDMTSDNFNNPTMNHVFNTLPNLPHSATSILSDDDDAIFCLALNDTSIFQIRLHNSTGVATKQYLKHDSSRRSILSGLTGALLGNRSQEDNYTISMVMEVRDDIFLFALARGGQLRVWSCTRFQCIGERNLIPNGQPNFTGQNHFVRKTWIGRSLTLVVYLSMIDKSQFLIMSPRIRNTTVTFENDINVFSAPENMNLLEMNVDCQGQTVWCIWRSLYTAEISVSAFSINSGQSTSCIRENKSTILDSSFRMGLSAREYFLSLIFAPGVFSRFDIAKVLRIYKLNPSLEVSAKMSELRTKVCLDVETEIQAEALEYELSDDDFIDISERCWNKFYTSCLQYHEAGKMPNNLFWLPSANLLAVTSKTGISFYRAVEILEETILCPESIKDSQCYKHLIEVLRGIEVSEDQNQKLIQSLKGFSPLAEAFTETVTEFKREEKLNSEIDNLMKYPNLSVALRQLSDVLFMPETFEISGDYFDSFRGELGLKIVFATIRQIVRTRMYICRNLALFLEVLHNGDLKNEFQAETLNLFSAYWILNWTCDTVIQDNANLLSLMHTLLVKPEIATQPLLLDTVWSVSQHLWLLTNNFNLAEFLYMNKQYHLLKLYSRMANSDPWKILLIQSYLDTNEPYKAADLVENMSDSPSACLKAIKFFEHVDHPDIVISLAERGIDLADSNNHPDLPTLFSILFLNQLKLGHFNVAFASLNKNPDRSRRVDCLRELVITLINANEIKVLLDIAYNDLLPQLEEIMEQRARSLQPYKATMYYNFLYALHMKSDNFKKAARIMFEQGFRSTDNKQQMSSYALCVNCLSLVEEENAWILKPKTTMSSMNEDEDEECLEILELAELKREYELSVARNKLSTCSPDTSVQEVVMKLISAGRYRIALKLCVLYKLNLEPAFEALAAACTRVPEDPDAWNWLIDNDVSDFVIGDDNAQVVAWRLLEGLLLSYEEPKMTIMHKAVASKIMSLDVVLPYWLESSYKKRNPSELLRLYLNYGNLNEASQLCCDYISAMLGKGKEIFDLEHSLSVASPSMYLPLNAIDILLHELEHHQMTDFYEDVKNAVNIYLLTVEKVSQDRISYLSNTAAAF